MYKFYFFYCLLSLTFLNSSCQRLDIKTIADEFCDCLNENKIESDSIRLKDCIDKTANNNKYKLNDSLILELDIYLFKNCREYAKSTRSNAVLFTDNEQVLSRKASSCNDFRLNKKLFYINSPNDTVFVDISNDIWSEKIDNKYYSNLSINWISDCSFQLIFIESNDPYKSKYSKKGDIYNYEIIDSDSSYYKMLLMMKDFKVEFDIYK